MTGTRKRIKAGAGERILYGINLILLLIFCFLCAYPIYFFIINSISSPDAIDQGLFLFPRELTLYNFNTLLEDEIIPHAFLVSVLRTLIGTTITCLCSSFAAYLFVQRDMPLRRFFYRMIVITMYLNSGLIPWYMVMKTYGMKNNFLLYILPGAVGAFYVILIKTYIESLPPAIEESAAIDGAGILRSYISVIFPLSLPVLASVAVFAAVGQWNAWYDNFMLVSEPSLKTLQLTLYDYLKKFTSTSMALTSSVGSAGDNATLQASPLSVRITITMITMVPIMLVYPLVQRHFVKGIVLGAVKG